MHVLRPGEVAGLPLRGQVEYWCEERVHAARRPGTTPQEAGKALNAAFYIIRQNELPEKFRKLAETAFFEIQRKEAIRNRN